MANATKLRTRSPMIETLRAEGPHPQYADKLMLFGRLVGNWDIEGRAFDESGNVIREVTGEWHFGWVLEGRVIQDVLIAPHARGASLGSSRSRTTPRFAPTTRKSTPGASP